MGIFDYKLEKSTSEKPIVLKLNGDLIGEQMGPELMAQIDELVNEGYHKLIVNLSNLNFISSSGIGILITMLTKVRNRGGEMVLVNPSEKLNQLLAMTKLLAIFKISNTVNEAEEILA